MNISPERTRQLNGTCVKLLLLLCVVGLCLAASPCVAAAAADGDETGASSLPRTQWGVARVQGLATFTLGDNHVAAWNDCGDSWFDYINFESVIDVNTTGGVYASFEYVFKRRYGIELGFTYWYEMVDLRFETEDYVVEGAPNFILPTLGANYHFLVDDRKDLYGGGFFSLGVIATGFATDIEVSKDFALGVTLGMDYYLNDTWSLGASAKYIDFGEIDFSLLPGGISGIICDNGLFGLGHLNVVSLTFGLGYRF